MTETTWRDLVPQVVMLMRIIVAAMTAGVLFFLAIATAVMSTGAERNWSTDVGLMTVMAVVFTIATLAARMVVVPMVVISSRKRIAQGQAASQQRGVLAERFAQAGQGGQMLALYQTSTIISLALLEGPAFFNSIVVLLEGSVVCLVLAIALAVGVAAHFPTPSRVTEWVEGQLRRAGEDQLLQR